ncbi:MAG: OB-fold domain-containing protein [Actinomycetes bacterium]
MTGIISYGAYIPYWRLQRSTLASALGSGGAKGARAVASFDEDTTSMGVEASRIALRGASEQYSPQSLWFATAEPGYLDKTNANAIHAALSLQGSVSAFDCLGSVRSGIAAVQAAASGNAMAVLSDIRTGLPGGSDESMGGDGAAAFCFGSEKVIAEFLGAGASTSEFVDRWRIPGDKASKQWEERFGEYAYAPLVEVAFNEALKNAHLTAADVSHSIFSGLHARAVKAAPKSCGINLDTLSDDFAATLGNSGTAHWGAMLANVLDTAEPHQVIAVVVLADGVNVMLFRTTDELVAYRSRQESSLTVQSQIAAGRNDLTYTQFLTWRGFMHREPPRRPEPDRPAGPPSLRTSAWKYGLYGSRDESGFVYLPPARVSLKSGSIDKMEMVRMADIRATIATYTVDHLAFSMSPPVVAAVIDFDGGGRFQCELTDVDPATVKIGDRVEMSFRRLYTQDGIHNYFWKAKPVRSGTK